MGRSTIAVVIVLGLLTGCLASSRKQAPAENGPTRPRGKEVAGKVPVGAGSGQSLPPEDAGPESAGSGQVDAASHDAGSEQSPDPSSPGAAPTTSKADHEPTWTAQVAGSQREPEVPEPAKEERPGSRRSNVAGGAARSQYDNPIAEDTKEDTVFMSLRSDPPKAVVGGVLEVEVLANTSAKVLDAPLTLAYEPSLLRFLDASQGNFLAQDGGNVVFMVNADSQVRDIVIGIGRMDRARGVSGNGVLCRFRFLALASGEASFCVSQAMAWGERGRTLRVESNPIIVSIR